MRGFPYARGWCIFRGLSAARKDVRGEANWEWPRSPYGGRRGIVREGSALETRSRCQVRPDSEHSPGPNALPRQDTRSISVTYGLGSGDALQRDETRLHAVSGDPGYIPLGKHYDM